MLLFYRSENMIQSVFPWLQYITITTLVCQMILVSSADATDDILIDWCIDGKQELNQDDIFHLLVKKVINGPLLSQL